MKRKHLRNSMFKFRTFLTIIYLTLSVICCTNALHIQGTFNPKEEFFHFLAKFGFQKTELRRRDDSQGFIYCNITLLNQNETTSGISSTKSLKLVIDKIFSSDSILNCKQFSILNILKPGILTYLPWHVMLDLGMTHFMHMILPPQKVLITSKVVKIIPKR